MSPIPAKYKYDDDLAYKIARGRRIRTAVAKILEERTQAKRKAVLQYLDSLPCLDNAVKFHNIRYDVPSHSISTRSIHKFNDKKSKLMSNFNSQLYKLLCGYTILPGPRREKNDIKPSNKIYTECPP